ncbi:hypothetical protein [Methanobacterium sp. SMA-27]|uniref:hypothetical protein n=1 Tax=Methanobacterium sp. SMA-27 TaxID=1495336 RepID=UPI000693416A|nr:hypothetical protein [Methanobacterium sp. SMA-27]
MKNENLNIESLEMKESYLDAYEREIGELKWKYDELSKSYKELISKHAKANKRLRFEDERIKTLEVNKDKLTNKLEELNGIHKTLVKKYRLEIKKNKILRDKLNLLKLILS